MMTFALHDNMPAHPVPARDRRETGWYRLRVAGQPCFARFDGAFWHFPNQPRRRRTLPLTTIMGPVHELTPAIEALEDEIARLDDQATALKSGVNRLREAAGMPPKY